MTESLKKQTVLLVDDTPENIEILNDILSPHYKIRFATNGEKALQTARSANPPDIVLLDIMMPGMSGYEVCKQLKSDPRTARMPVIFVTALGEETDEKKGFDCGAVDYITKPVNALLVKARVRTHLALYDQQRELEHQVLEQTHEINAARLEIIHHLGRAAEYKDNETGLHVIRMSHYTRLLGTAVGLPELEVDTLFNAAPMHDVGKIGVPDSILRKPGPLDDAEWVLMKKHPEMGAQIIGGSSSKLLQTAATIARTHHEKWDGTGYPAGLAGEAIPLVGRIVAIADVFDALTSERPYKKAWPVEKAIDVLRESSGKHFDPILVPLFIERQDAVTEVLRQFAESARPDSSA